MAGQLAEDIWDRTPQTEQRDRTAGTGQSRQASLTGHPGWVSLDRTERTGLPGHDSVIKSAVDKGVWAEQLEQDSWEGQHTARTGQLGLDSQDRKESQEWKAGTGKSGKDSTSRIGNRGRTARI